MSRGATGCTPRGRGERLSPPRGARWRCTFAVACCLALATALAGSPPSRADGDPASDYLLLENAFVTYQTPSPAAAAALETAANAVYQHGERVKVAVIYDVADLGSLPSLFGRPMDYAQFLGLELSLWYAGPLLVVMPGGFGIYDSGRSTAAEQHVLQTIPAPGGSPDELVNAATTALDDLAAAGALSSADIRAPLVTVHPASARLGKPTTLHFQVFDDSGRAAATVRVYEKSELLSTILAPPVFTIGTRDVAVPWLVPAKLRSRQLRFCVVATDRAGNRSKPECAPFLDVR